MPEENQNFNSDVDSNKRPFYLPVSIQSYTRSKDIVSVLFFINYSFTTFFEFHIQAEQEDIQSLSAIVGAICAICFSLPILLKEVNFRSTFWQQFFISGFMAFIATFLGVISFYIF